MNRHADWNRYLRNRARRERVHVGRARRIIRAFRRAIVAEDEEAVFGCLAAILRHEDDRTKNDVVSAFCRMRELDFEEVWVRVRSVPRKSF